MKDNKIMVQVLGVKLTDWTNPDTNIRYNNTKVWVSVENHDSESLGKSSVELRLPPEIFEKFKGKSFPLSGTLVIGDFNLNNRTFKCLDIII